LAFPTLAGEDLHGACVAFGRYVPGRASQRVTRKKIPIGAAELAQRGLVTLPQLTDFPAQQPVPAEDVCMDPQARSDDSLGRD